MKNPNWNAIANYASQAYKRGYNPLPNIRKVLGIEISYSLYPPVNGHGWEVKDDGEGDCYLVHHEDESCEFIFATYKRGC